MEHVKGFDRRAFNVKFEELLEQIKGAERITKPVLAELSRTLLIQIHFDGDIQPVNRLLDVLTLMNRKTFVLYFLAFSGFHHSDKTGYFHKKDKQHYEAKVKAAEEALLDDFFNVWTWAEREVKIEAKPFSLDKVTKFIGNSLKKAEENGFSHIDVLKAIIAGGLSADDFIQALEAIGAVDIAEAPANDEQKEQAA